MFFLIYSNRKLDEMLNLKNVFSDYSKSYGYIIAL